MNMPRRGVGSNQHHDKPARTTPPSGEAAAFADLPAADPLTGRRTVSDKRAMRIGAAASVQARRRERRWGLKARDLVDVRATPYLNDAGVIVVDHTYLSGGGRRTIVSSQVPASPSVPRRVRRAEFGRTSGYVVVQLPCGTVSGPYDVNCSDDLAWAYQDAAQN